MQYLTRQQAKDVDEKAVKFFGLETIQMMESAGRITAEFLRDKIGNMRKRKILILAGKGHNGGDALIAARYLQNFGAECNVILPVNSPDDLIKETKWNFGILKSMHVNHLFLVHQMQYDQAFKQADVIIDGLLGYNTESDPKGPYADLINAANETKKKILSIDIPSGLNADIGEAYSPTIRAKWTLSFCLPKAGCMNKKEFTGELYTADIGIPNEVYTLLGLEIPNIFEKNSVVRI